jgi:AcrR family transcriptional regulator
MSIASSRPRKRTPSPARAQKTESTRARLIAAAAKVIGKYGYGGCSIARITRRAGVAHGAFYLPFKSQQELFDQILPTLGHVMLDAISHAIRDSTDIVELEQRGLEENFAYLSKHPYMYRVMNEAELYAPNAFKTHMDDMIARYSRSLHRSLLNHQVHDFSSDDLEALAAMLMGARAYLLMRFCADKSSIKPLPPEMVDRYIRFVVHGLGVQSSISVANNNWSKQAALHVGSPAEPDDQETPPRTGGARARAPR